MDDRVRQDSFPAASASVGQARRFVADVLREFGLADLIDEAVVVVSELATNAVRHAGTTFSVTVDCRSGAGALLSLRDGSSQRPVAGRAGPLEERGRGLALVEGLCRDWGVTSRADGGKVVWAQLDADSRAGYG